MAEDNWENRSEGMKCITCMYFVVKSPSTGKQVVGRCRKRAPRLEGWPVVFISDWCGDHKLDENKI